MFGKFRQSTRKALAARFSKAELLSMQASTSKWPKFRDDFSRFSRAITQHWNHAQAANVE
jgi:hypothetical protein